MTSVLCWAVLQAAAVAIVFTKGSIFKKLREVGPKLWRDLADCPICSGVWIGAGRVAVEPGAWTWLRGLETLGWGCVTGVVALGAWELIEALGAYSASVYGVEGEQPTGGKDGV